ncbi:MAG TPA: hypothetical protein VEC16_03275 [Alphaproteobacteria bacterium]|nr:hypothetical protein [Alphaproteobacteria bacterium]
MSDLVKILDGKTYLAKRDALEVGKYYYKGFTNVLNTIISKADNYMINPHNEKYMIDAYSLYAGIENHYNKIPFETIYRKERFYPLFVVKDFLPQFHNKMDDVFKFKKENSVEELKKSGIALAAVGSLYYNSLTEAVKNARSYPDLKDFKLELKVWDGSTFLFDPKD